MFRERDLGTSINIFFLRRPLFYNLYRQRPPPRIWDGTFFNVIPRLAYIGIIGHGVYINK